MKKAFLIGWKDLTLAFRDRAALIFMLAAPFALTLGMGLVTGRFSGNTGSTGVGDIPIVIIDQDGGQLAQTLVEVLQSEELSDLLEPSLGDDLAAAQAAIEADEIAAALVIPAGFTDSIIPHDGQTAPSETVQLALYSNPTRPTSVGVVRTILDGFLSQVEVNRVGAEVIITRLIATGRLQPQEAAGFAQTLAVENAAAGGQPSAISLNSVTASGEEVEFDILAILAPGMALMFLMFTASNGGRSLLIERNHGTLPRLLVSPTGTAQVLAGKTIGIYLTGVAQMLILILGTTLLFQVQWGNMAGVLLLVLASVFGAVGWGLFITAIARTPGQVAAVGSALMLTFGILGGTFINTNNMPAWYRWLTRITPNAWGVDGFTTLALGGRLADILEPLLALVVMGLVLFGVAMLLFNRRGLTQK
jgi:ABC-2 type transport system permease protein